MPYSRRAASRHVGIELQQWLHATIPALPIIMMTSRREDVIRERAQHHGCAAFFWKPLDSNTLAGHHRVARESVVHTEDSFRDAPLFRAGQ